MILRGFLIFYAMTVMISLICESIVITRALWYKFELNPFTQLALTIFVSVLPGANLMVSLYDIALALSPKITFMIKTSGVLSGNYNESDVKIVHVDNPEELKNMLEKFKPEDGWSVIDLRDKDEDEDK